MILSILSTFCLTLTPMQNNIYINLPYDDKNFLVTDTRPNCIVLSTYFAINFTAVEQKLNTVSYKDLKCLVENQFKNTYCSLLDLQHFLKRFKIKSKVISLKDKNNILNPKFKFFILYIPPKDTSQIGHFAFCSNLNRNVYLWDPMLTSKLKSNLEDYPEIMKNWNGVILWIE